MAEINNQLKKKSSGPFIYVFAALIVIVFLMNNLQSQPGPQRASSSFSDTSRVQHSPDDTLSIIKDSTTTDTTNNNSR